jgi:murein DD-endopeptidase MepM/ murein hydrolase activator NlpD
MFLASLVLAQAVVAAPATVPAQSDFRLAGPMMQGGMIRGTAPTGSIALMLNGAPVKLGLDGAFVIGFGREASSPAVLTATLPDGKTISKTLNIAARAYRLQAVNGVPPKTVNIPPELEARRTAEVAQIRAARSTISDRRDWQTTFIWPAEGRISGVYGSQRIYNGIDKGSAHLGVDVAAPKGAPVFAPAGGIVKLAAPDFLLEGGLLMIDHGFGIYSSFLHLSHIDVKPGDEVRQGQKIAAVGGTGRATGPHLHWNLNWGAERLDVQLLMPPRPGMVPAGIKPADPAPAPKPAAPKPATVPGQNPLKQ